MPLQEATILSSVYERVYSVEAMKGYFSSLTLEILILECTPIYAFAPSSLQSTSESEKDLLLFFRQLIKIIRTSMAKKVH